LNTYIPTNFFSFVKACCIGPPYGFTHPSPGASDNFSGGTRPSLSSHCPDAFRHFPGPFFDSPRGIPVLQGEKRPLPPPFWMQAVAWRESALINRIHGKLTVFLLRCFFNAVCAACDFAPWRLRYFLWSCSGSELVVKDLPVCPSRLFRNLALF